MLGGIKGRRRRGRQKVRWLDGISAAMNMNLGKLWEMVRDREAWGAGVTKSRTQLGNCTTTKKTTRMEVIQIYTTSVIKNTHIKTMRYRFPSTMMARMKKADISKC